MVPSPKLFTSESPNWIIVCLQLDANILGSSRPLNWTNSLEISEVFDISSKRRIIVHITDWLTWPKNSLKPYIP